MVRGRLSQGWGLEGPLSPRWKATTGQLGAITGCLPVPPPPISTFAERPDFTDAIILRKGASVEHVVSRRDVSRRRVRELSVPAAGFGWTLCQPCADVGHPLWEQSGCGQAPESDLGSPQPPFPAA